MILSNLLEVFRPSGIYIVTKLIKDRGEIQKFFISNILNFCMNLHFNAEVGKYKSFLPALYFSNELFMKSTQSL